MNSTQNFLSIEKLAAYTPSSSSPPTLVYADGSLYFGSIDTINRVPFGMGIMIYKYNEPNNFFNSPVVKNTTLTSCFAAGDRYSGGWVDGYFEGEGALIRSTWTYQGGWRGGRPHGKGKMTFKKSYVDPVERSRTSSSLGGAVWHGLTQLSPFEVDMDGKPQEYVGDFDREHYRHGEGKMVYYDGSVYEGSWVDNTRTGFGKFTSSDGDVYEGHWLNDEKHGIGKIVYLDGSIFKGVIERNKRHGPGSLRFANGDEYVGNFSNNLISGVGSMKYRNGDIYEGEWCENRRHGMGKYTLKKNNAIMKGVFKHGLIHGKGTLELPGFSIFAGMFKHGSRSEGTVYWREEADEPYCTMLCYQGGWKGEVMHGKGVLWFRDGSFYYGQFEENKMKGPGNLRYANGDEYSGSFANGVPHGWGILQYHGEDSTEGSSSPHLRRLRAGLWFQGNFVEGYDGEWNGIHLHGIGELNIAAHRLFSPPNNNKRAVMSVMEEEEGQAWEASRGMVNFKGVFLEGARDGPGILRLPAVECFPWPHQVAFRKKNIEQPYLLRQHILKGSWKNNKMICEKGVWAFPTGEVYVGGFSNDFPDSAVGRMWMADGSVFIGKWSNGAPSGDGTFFSFHSADQASFPQPVNAGTGSVASLLPSGKGGDRTNLANSSEEVLFSGFLTGFLSFNRSSRVSSPKLASSHHKRSVTTAEFSHVLLSSWVQCTWSGKKSARLAAPNVLPFSSWGSHPWLPSSNEVNSFSRQEACGTGSTAWLNGPQSVERVKYISNGEVTKLIAASQSLPDNSSIGTAESEGLTLFGSGIMVLNRFCCNRPQVAIPHRARSLYDSYLQSVHKLKDTLPLVASSLSKEIQLVPSNCSPFYPSLDQITPAEFFSIPNWEAYKPLRLSLTKCGELTGPPQKITQCSFCRNDFSFFRPATECSLCFRASCSGCLQTLEAKNTPHLEVLFTSAQSILQSFKMKNGSPSSPPVTVEAQSISVCGDCFTAIKEEWTSGIVWLPVHIFSSILGVSSKRPSRRPSLTSLAEPERELKDGNGSITMSGEVALQSTSHNVLDASVQSIQSQSSTHGKLHGSESIQSISSHEEELESAIPVGIPTDMGKLESDSFVTYGGYMVRGTPHLFGEMWWGSDAYYVGGFDYGTRSGVGYQAFASGDVYMGWFRDNTWNGSGYYVFKDGNVAQGIFKKGQIDRVEYVGGVNESLRYHGLGIQVSSNGTTYNGEWKNGQKHGQGVLTFYDGSSYTGSFVAGTIEGRGKLKSNSSLYIGDFKDGVKSGKGLEFFKDCAVEATWKDDAVEGFCRVFLKTQKEVYETTYIQGNERNDCFWASRQWKADETPLCQKCGSPFHLFLRRHHCRLCGGIFCDSCSNSRLALPSHVLTAPTTDTVHRVCVSCFHRLEQRRSIAIRRYSTGEVYAGCWSRGQWVSRGIYTRPDGLFVVMDEDGRPMHAQIEKKKTRNTKAVSSPATPTLQDASISRSACSHITESSSFAALADFIRWWEGTKKECNLSVPLIVSVAINFQKQTDYFIHCTAKKALQGSREASLLAEPCAPCFSYPVVPTIPAPLRFSLLPQQEEGGKPFHSKAEFIDVIREVLISARSPPTPPAVATALSLPSFKRSSNPFLNGIPQLQQYDVSDEEVEKQMVKHWNAHCQQLSPSPGDGSRTAFPSLIRPTPPAPAIGSDSVVHWEDWEVRKLPLVIPDAAAVCASLHGEGEEIGTDLGFNLGHYFTLPFWRSSIIGVEEAIERGKIRKAQEMMECGSGGEQQNSQEGRERLVAPSVGWLPGLMTPSLVLEEQPCAEFFRLLSSKNTHKDPC